MYSARFKSRFNLKFTNDSLVSFSVMDERNRGAENRRAEANDASSMRERASRFASFHASRWWRLGNGKRQLPQWGKCRLASSIHRVVDKYWVPLVTVNGWSLWWPRSCITSGSAPQILDFHHILAYSYNRRFNHSTDSTSERRLPT